MKRIALTLLASLSLLAACEKPPPEPEPEMVTVGDWSRLDSAGRKAACMSAKQPDGLFAEYCLECMERVRGDEGWRELDFDGALAICYRDDREAGTLPEGAEGASVRKRRMPVDGLNVAIWSASSEEDAAAMCRTLEDAAGMGGAVDCKTCLAGLAKSRSETPLEGAFKVCAKANSSFVDIEGLRVEHWAKATGARRVELCRAIGNETGISLVDCLVCLGDLAEGDFAHITPLKAAPQNCKRSKPTSPVYYAPPSFDAGTVSDWLAQDRATRRSWCRSAARAIGYGELSCMGCLDELVLEPKSHAWGFSDAVALCKQAQGM